MSATSDAAPTGLDGSDEVVEVEQRLAREFTALAPDAVHRCVLEVAAAFAEAPIRAYVPVLVERLARDRLRTVAGQSQHRATLTIVPSPTEVA